MYFKIFTPYFYRCFFCFYMEVLFWGYIGFIITPKSGGKMESNVHLRINLSASTNLIRYYIRSQKLTRNPTFHDLGHCFSFWDVFQVLGASWRQFTPGSRCGSHHFTKKLRCFAFGWYIKPLGIKKHGEKSCKPTGFKKWFLQSHNLLAT